MRSSSAPVRSACSPFSNSACSASKSHLIDILDKPGGQCAELYPEKPIYDIPAWPVISGQDLTDRLMEQIAPFKPVPSISARWRPRSTKLEGGRWRMTTDTGQTLTAPVVIVAAGGGSFVPKKPPLARHRKL